MLNAGSVILSIGIGIVLGVLFIAAYVFVSRGKSESLKKEGGKLLEEARRRAEAISKEAALEAKDLVIQSRTEAEKEMKERRQELNHLERRVRQKEETHEQKLDLFEKRLQETSKRESEINDRLRSIQEKETQHTNLLAEQKAVLENISGMDSAEARQELFKRVEEESKFEAAKLAKRIEDEAREGAQKKAREVLGASIQRYSSDYVSDATVTAVSLPNDEMKGRIIGREGRNIRALEAATGVDLIVDDTPETITLSGFDPVRREVARLSLEKLISDGRIHPSRIEEVVEKVSNELESVMREEGEAAVFDVGLAGVHSEIVKLLGRLRYRTSYGQNVLKHSREVAYLAGMMAGELGADIKSARRAGLLHDIGKAMDHEVEGSHQEIGANFAKKHGENAHIENAIRVHHGEGDPESVEAALVAAADALSAARPGVRSESIENYIKRLEKLEELAMMHKGVEKCYAIQAGREVRIIVKPDEVSDDSSYTISKELAKKIEEEMTYPGQIKVMVIRESRYVEYAR